MFIITFGKESLLFLLMFEQLSHTEHKVQALVILKAEVYVHYYILIPIYISLIQVH